MARSVILSFAVLLAAFEIGSCYRCYQCNSQSELDCLDPFQQGTGRHLVDCNSQDSVSYNRAYLRDILPAQFLDGVTGAPRQCAKIVLESGTVIRTCLDVNPVQPDQACLALQRSANEYPSAGKRLKSCNICDRDTCNGAGSITASLPIALVALVASYLYYK